eukprot:COSAG02_NODE_12138_length_1591_cov_1.335791_1_plen_147_part_00
MMMAGKLAFFLAVSATLLDDCVAGKAAVGSHPCSSRLCCNANKHDAATGSPHRSLKGPTAVGWRVLRPLSAALTSPCRACTPGSGASPSARGHGLPRRHRRCVCRREPGLPLPQRRNYTRRGRRIAAVGSRCACRRRPRIYDDPPG